MHKELLRNVMSTNLVTQHIKQDLGTQLIGTFQHEHYAPRSATLNALFPTMYFSIINASGHIDHQYS